MISDKVRPHRLERKAILYVRQSSAHQVLHNRESSALQYAMRDRLTACSEKRHYQPCRPPHERKLGDQTKDDADKEPHEERSCGRSQTLLYNGRRPHSSLDESTADQAYFNSLPLRLAA